MDGKIIFIKFQHVYGAGDQSEVKKMSLNLFITIPGYFLYLAFHRV